MNYFKTPTNNNGKAEQSPDLSRLEDKLDALDNVTPASDEEKTELEKARKSVLNDLGKVR